MSGVHIIWFRRDLRVHDHAALAAAMASGGSVLPLYIFEPGFWALPEHSRRQFDFLMDSLTELDEALTARGARLCVRTGDALDVLADLHRRHGIEAIHMHEETSLPWSRARDRAVRRWAVQAGISLREQPQLGVIRGPGAHEDWKARWTDAMKGARHKAPDSLRAAAIPSGPWPIAEDFGLGADDCPDRQKGGRTAGVEVLRSFLAGRGRRYRQDVDRPAAAETSSSRLSPHLAFGTISVREAWQGAARALAAYEQDGDTTFTASLAGFLDRLERRSRSIQSLEDHPLPQTGSGESLRPEATEGDLRLETLMQGRTGFPLIDSSIRALRATGWLNFRLRALLVGFATHHLWMDWRRPSERLAALFTDFEPGIHYPQALTQSAVKGSNGPRVWNPVKQSLEQDPDGAFIRRWVPELAALPDAYLHAPWEAPKAELARAGVIFGQTYPMRMVDHVAAAREARERIAAANPSNRNRRPDDVRQADLPFRSPRPRPVRHTKSAPVQLSFDLGSPTSAPGPQPRA
ncbi:MAG TPA: FAD-binding domain-containing protein [Hyphomonas sp.]|nr:FAD-binding domain-containing protein [Hyphomonas sp.]